MSASGDDAALDAALRRVWGSPPGIHGFLTNVNHKSVGVRFMVTSFVFFLVGGLEALVMRSQLLRPEGQLLSPERYNQLFTMHGSTMMFLFAVPFFEGLAMYLVPLMIGARDMAFPRLNAFGYFVYLFAGVALHYSLIAGVAPDSGWFNYPPLSGPGYAPGVNIDYWVTMITFLEVAALVAAVELVVTILKQRAPGMALSRMPLFVWSMLVTAWMILFAMPPLVMASLMLGLDRIVGTHFFNVAAGGVPLLWQHLFWFFGHPDVYIILLPGLGVASTIVPVAARRPIAGYTAVALSTVAIGVLSFGLWVHHMYATGLPLLGMSFFSAASMMITIPSGIAIFAWIVTLWRGAPVLHAPALFVVGFIVIFLLGGLTGIMVASVPLDLQLHDSYFVVAHLHYVLIGTAMFPILAALHFWIPKMTGFTLREGLGRATFWLVFIGFHVTFFPMHELGLRGMPRRVYTYLPGLGWDAHNAVATLGAFALGAGVLVFLFNVGWSAAARRRAGEDPWNGATLEWTVASPPPAYNFLRIPVVNGRDTPGEARQVRALALDDPADVRRETLMTTVLGAAPERRLLLAGPSIWPFWLAVALSLAFLGALIDTRFVLLGGALALIALLGWNWPAKEGARR
ncbi:cytochrome c oxidase subunit I [Sorangium sp. So ce233]|uniref:cytochrome c oxidase subunit I n=1 Tax=Sorangium sp. So ce233 TaxID=3133290 RepID=UPI003F626647